MGPVQSGLWYHLKAVSFAKIQTWWKTVAHGINIHIIKITVGKASGGTIMKSMIIKWRRKVKWQQKSVDSNEVNR